MQTNSDPRSHTEFREEIGHSQPCTIEELAHTAEIGLRVTAAEPATLFACLARAMFELVGATVEDGSPDHGQTVQVDGADAESLLVNWLNELLYLHEVSGQVFLDCRVSQWSPTELTASVVGRPSVASLHMHIKAVTYHDLRVEETPAGWQAQVVFDI